MLGNKVHTSTALARAGGPKKAKDMWHTCGPHAVNVTPYLGHVHRLIAHWFMANCNNRFVKEMGQWRFIAIICHIHFRTPYEQGQVKQPDCRRSMPILGLDSDLPPTQGRSVVRTDGTGIYLYPAREHCW